MCTFIHICVYIYICMCVFIYLQFSYDVSSMRRGRSSWTVDAEQQLLPTKKSVADPGILEDLDHHRMCRDKTTQPTTAESTQPYNREL